jgi:hypothetical protein
MITGTFNTAYGVVTVEVDAGTATGQILSVGSIKYEFDITPDSVVIDRLMAVYQRFDVSWLLNTDDGQDLYDLFTAGDADVTVTIAGYDGNTYVFPFMLKPFDVSVDEKSQTVKTSLSVFVDESVTVGDVWAQIDPSDVFDFRFTHSGGGSVTRDATSPNLWMIEALGQILGTSTNPFFESYPVGEVVNSLPELYNTVDPTTNNGKVCLVCLDVAGETIDGLSADDFSALAVVQTMAGFDGGIFGTGFNSVFYVNRTASSVALETITYDEVLDLKFDRNYKAFQMIAVGTILRHMDGANKELPNFDTFSFDSGVLNQSATNSVSIQLQAGFPVLCGGVIATAFSWVNGSNLADMGLIRDGGLFGAVESYKLALPASGTLTISATFYGFGRVKPWESFQLDTTVPPRYQGRKFRINSAEYDIVQNQTKIRAYEAESFESWADAYTARVVADGGATTGLAKTRKQLFAIWYLQNPVIYLMNGFKDSSTLIDKWYNWIGTDGTSTGTSRPTLTSGFSDFDGSNDYVDVAHNANQLLTGGGTLMAWIRVDSQGIGTASTALIDKSNGITGNSGWRWGVRGDSFPGGIFFQINSGTVISTPNNSISLNNWFHVAVAFTSGGVLTMYVNGLSVSTGTTGSASGITTTNALRIGNRSGATDRAFDGEIDAPFVSSQQLTASQVLAYYEATRSLYF